MDTEIWRGVDGYEGLYQVSNFGRVRSLKFGRVLILKPATDKDGYLFVSLRRDGKVKHHKVHRLVAQAFIPNSEGKSCVNHVDGIKTDNRVENLEWCTPSENQHHAYATGLHGSGEEHHRAKLTNEQVRFIRENPDGLTCAELARLFGVDPSTISDIQRGKRYKNVGGNVRKPIDTRIPDEIRDEIRRLYAKGSREFGSPALARKYGVGRQVILNIVHEK